MYTVKQLSKLAGVSNRTLHYYDEIGLLTPTVVANNGYRFYDQEALLRLQQILFYKELDIPLENIKDIIDRSGFNQLEALQAHREALLKRVQRLNHLIQTIDKTVRHLQGDYTMKQEEYFEGFSEEQQKEYAEEARKRYGDEAVNESEARWNSYSKEQKNAIFAKGKLVMEAFANAMNREPSDPEVQKLALEWHHHIENFYACSYERLRGLGDLYVEDPAFTKNIDRGHPGLAAFIHKAIAVYCEGKTGFLKA